MTAPTIRFARTSDLKAIKEVELAAASRFKGLGLVDHLMDHHFEQTLLKTLIKEEQVWISVCEQEQNKVTGFAIATVLGPLAYLEELDVLPGFGRQGIGRALVLKVVDWAREKKFGHLTLSTFAHIPWNAPFYEKLGFTVLPQKNWESQLHEIYMLEQKIGLPVEKRVFMRLKL